jgi:hypothetical protein
MLDEANNMIRLHHATNDALDDLVKRLQVAHVACCMLRSTVDHGYARTRMHSHAPASARTHTLACTHVRTHALARTHAHTGR